jgi:molybdopterin-guanine dinucleotide biosynthesis protein B
MSVFWHKTIAIVGPSNSGKTELICRLLDWFQGQALKVAVLKHSHKSGLGLGLGEEGKDTGRYRKHGARTVALAAPGLMQVTHYLIEDPPLAKVLAALSPEADLILVEGYKSSALPKIALVGSKLENVLPDHSQVIALVSPDPLESEVPVFQSLQVGPLGQFILKYLDIGLSPTNVASS